MKYLKIDDINKLYVRQFKGDLVFKPSLNEMIYTDSQRDFFKKLIDNLKENNLNVLLSGKAGTGKTTTVKMLATETKKPLFVLMGSGAKEKVFNDLINLKKGSIVLIDEIHNLKERVAELIYPAIETNELYLNGQKHILNCSFFGTTTEPQKMPKPLLDRFFMLEFDEPSVEQFKAILLKDGVPEDILNLLLSYSNNIRVIKKILTYVKMYGQINEENLLKVFELMQIDKEGFTKDQRIYMEYLRKNGLTSLRTLSLILRISEERIKYDIEEELIRKGLLKVSSRGRELIIQ